MNIVFALLNFVLGLLGYAKKGSKPSADERAGRAEAVTEIQQRTQADVQAATVAARAVRDNAVRAPERVRDKDPYSRD